LHEPPRRVNIKLPYTPITVSDFLFPGETQEESVKAVEEMLGFTPNFEHLDDELEIVASPQHIRVCILLFSVVKQSSGSLLAAQWYMVLNKRVQGVFIDNILTNCFHTSSTLSNKKFHGLMVRRPAFLTAVRGSIPLAGSFFF
jgi:hypothetical protein